MSIFRFALPPSTGIDELDARIAALRDYLKSKLSRDVDVTVSRSYEVLTRNLLSGAVDAAWAPPFVCAQTEPQGARVLLRTVRRGRSTYRSALLVKKQPGRADHVDTTLPPDALPLLRGKSAVWVDPSSVAGYLLPTGWLRGHGLPPDQLFARQGFAGSYPAGLNALLEGQADLACIHALADNADAIFDAIDMAIPGASRRFSVFAVTDETPSDGVVVGEAALDLGDALSAAMIGLASTDQGRATLDEIFHADGFEPTPQGGYRALYQVARMGGA
jgi:phosphonate transport system substrate-binding protein